MQIGVVSDSHGNIEALQQAISKMKDVDYIFHLGDHVTDGALIREFTDVPVYTMRGNMDYDQPDDFGEDVLEIDLEGIKILACHGHQFGVKSGLNRLYYEASSREAQIVLYGHTHVAFNEEWDGIYFMNPGALARGRSFSAMGKTYGIIKVEEKKIIGELFPVE